MAVIQVEQVRKTFGARDALTEVSFSIPKGEIFGFLGPSGAGKTTLIKILTAQLKPTGGVAKVFDQPHGGDAAVGPEDAFWHSDR